MYQVDVDHVLVTLEIHAFSWKIFYCSHIEKVSIIELVSCTIIISLWSFSFSSIIYMRLTHTLVLVSIYTCT